jgi:DNA-binding IclR family transcriptional regulator
VKQDATENEPKQDYHVQVLERVFRILDELAAGSTELPGGEIAGRVKLHRSTTHRLLAVLEKNRFVERNPENARYRLGWRLFELGIIAASRLDVYERAKPQLQRLVDETGETAHIGVLRQGEVISLLNVEGKRSVRTPATVGRRTPPHCTSQGKAILAFAGPEQIESAIDWHRFTRFTENTITDGSRFRTELALVRRRGYAVDNEEFEPGLRCIAAPVRDHTGEVIAAISIAGPSFRIGNQQIAALSRSVIGAAGRLSASLGYRGNAESERRPTNP